MREAPPLGAVALTLGSAVTIPWAAGNSVRSISTIIAIRCWLGLIFWFVGHKIPHDVQRQHHRTQNIEGQPTLFGFLPPGSPRHYVQRHCHVSGVKTLSGLDGAG